MAFNPTTKYDIYRTNISIRDFHQYEEDYETRPPYQRKVVWDDRKQKALMDSLFRRYYIPSIVLREVTIGEQQSKWEVVDGQQRITSVQKFFRNELPLPESLEDISPELPGKTYSELPTDIRKFVDKHLKFDVDQIKHIGDAFDSTHQKIVTDIFWRLQQGESLNKMEVLHARLTSPVRNFLVKYADDYDFDHKSYKAIDPNPDKHIFFPEIYAKTNSRMQHLRMLGQFLLLERADGPTHIGDSEITALIDDTRQDDGIGNTSYENEKAAKSTLNMLNQLYKVFKDDPKLGWQGHGVGVQVFKDMYFVVSLYLLLRHLQQHYAYNDKIRRCFRDFAYKFFERTRTKFISAKDRNARDFTEHNQQDETSITIRHRIIRYEFFSYARENHIKIISKDTKRAFDEGQRIAIFLKDDGICQQCLAEGLPEKEARVPWSEFEADHIIPWVKGGETEIWNGQVLCRQHNRAKGAKM